MYVQSDTKVQIPSNIRSALRTQKKAASYLFLFIIHYGDFIDMCKSSFHRCEIVLVIHSGEHSVKVVCRELSDLANFTQPHAPGQYRKIINLI